eukprot:scaffold7504_cov97-Cylindrotheca_fusiformis.AAC.8
MRSRFREACEATDYRLLRRGPPTKRGGGNNNNEQETRTNTASRAHSLCRQNAVIDITAIKSTVSAIQLLPSQFIFSCQPSTLLSSQFTKFVSLIFSDMGIQRIKKCQRSYPDRNCQNSIL